MAVAIASHSDSRRAIVQKKDRVFGLYGVLRSFIPLPEPDYGKSIEEIYSPKLGVC